MTTTDSAAPGLPAVVGFRTDHLDEAVDFIRRRFGDHSRVSRDRGLLGFDLVMSSTGRSAAGTQSLAIPTTVRASARSVMVHLPMQHGAEYQVGRRRHRSAPEVAMLLVPGNDYTVRTPPGPSQAMQLDASFLEAELDARRVGRARSWRLHCVELPLLPGESGELRSMVTAHAAAARAVQVSDGVGDIQAVEQRFASWLATLIARTSGFKVASPSSRLVAEKVESWIRSHASEPITLEQLSDIAGVSARMLQKACIARWGQSPLELVASRRLEAVRAVLTESSGVASVTDAALRGGFTHLGRFAVLYKRTFGEAPSDTLARQRRAMRSRSASSVAMRSR